MVYSSIAQNNKSTGSTIPVWVVVCATLILAGLLFLLGVAPAGAQTVDPAALRNTALTSTNSLKIVTVSAPSTFSIDIRPDTRASDPNILQPGGREALQSLSKALFWDQQVGSDGQACAAVTATLAYVQSI